MKRATRFAEFKKQLGDNFNPRPREEGDQTLRYGLNSTAHFNPRPREEGDRNKSRYYLGDGYFNPRPREEGDKITKILQLLEGISIHALVKRATAKQTFSDGYELISIHALVKRATCRLLGRQLRF